jgi:hypothetical protein
LHSRWTEESVKIPPRAVVLSAISTVTVIVTLMAFVTPRSVSNASHDAVHIAAPVEPAAPAGSSVSDAHPWPAPDRGVSTEPFALPDEAPADFYGNEVTHAVATYKLDPTGAMYEEHSPQTELPKLAGPKG